MSLRLRWAPALCALSLSFPALAQEKVDLAAVHRIKAEAFQHSQVMDHLFWLTDANGPRLTASPGYKSAAQWAVKSLKSWGASGAQLERWGTFGRGWSVSRFSAHQVAPTYTALDAVPLAWSGGTTAPVTAEVVFAPLLQSYERDQAADLEWLAARIRTYAQEHKGKLRGRFVLLSDERDMELPKDGVGVRYDDAKLAQLAASPDPVLPQQVDYPLSRMPRDPKQRRALYSQLPLEVNAELWDRGRLVMLELYRFLVSEGVAGILTTDNRGDGGLVFAEDTGAWEATQALPPPAAVIAPEQYSRIVRLVERGMPVKLELDLRVATTENEPGQNVVAEIPGGKKRNEVVMLGAHLDSWHGGTGATDNAAGSAVMLEAFRILKALDLPMDRTVRLALWDGEEQGLFGSRGYVRSHFGDPVSMQLKPEHGKLAAYFNLDNGAGKVRGVYLQGNDMVRPVFESWLAPFRDLGATQLTLRNTGGTDHLSFDAVGLPGFQFIQDPLDYGSRTHHSNLDVSDHVEASDLMQAAAVVASFVYHAANRPEMLPRKPLPAPLRKSTLKAPALGNATP